MADEDGEGLRDRITRQSEDALGKLAQDLLENPLVNGAITKAFSARERAVSAQEAAMGALNIPSAADIERLTRRLRSVSYRLEGIEDGVGRLDRALAPGGVEARLTAIEEQLEALTRKLDSSHEREPRPKSSQPSPSRARAASPPTTKGGRAVTASSAGPKPAAPRKAAPGRD